LFPWFPRFCLPLRVLDLHPLSMQAVKWRSHFQDEQGVMLSEKRF
jgi:hypothetical protein